VGVKVPDSKPIDAPLLQVRGAPAPVPSAIVSSRNSRLRVTVNGLRNRSTLPRRAASGKK
jgi:hypothetical protein